MVCEGRLTGHGCAHRVVDEVDRFGLVVASVGLSRWRSLSRREDGSGLGFDLVGGRHACRLVGPDGV